MRTLKETKKELSRQLSVAAVELDCLDLDVEEVRPFVMFDYLSYQRLRARLSRLKNDFGYEFETKMDGTDLTVKRIH